MAGLSRSDLQSLSRSCQSRIDLNTCLACCCVVGVDIDVDFLRLISAVNCFWNSCVDCELAIFELISWFLAAERVDNVRVIVGYNGESVLVRDVDDDVLALTIVAGRCLRSLFGRIRSPAS